LEESPSGHVNKLNPVPDLRQVGILFLKNKNAHVEKVMKNWSRSSLGCCENEMMIQRGDWKS